MATMRMAGSSVLGTVTDSAVAISSIVNTLAGGANILNDYVTTARNKQREANVESMLTFRDHLMEDAALEAVKREENIRMYIGNDPAKQEAYTKFYKRLEQAFEKYDNKNLQDSE